ncbi:hypothetical protein CVV38_02120 [Candidatus Peregrinibacteria bacterium HGW-Peregrinibacteria-1]|jgi:Tol biopolymer transport system component|nr:MAG: hypothetical protein CVV38_02120 [Candidatus Peregrinibacteria bacterium HGW-Peregrinibacteria-1]
MSSTKHLKISIGITIALLVINVLLIIIFPSKPLKIKDIITPNSAIDPQIKISFSEPVEKSSLTDGGFIITPNIAGNISWAGNTFVFTPEQNLDFDTEYRIQLNTVIESKRNTRLAENINLTFKTPPLQLLYLNKKNEISSQIFQYNIETGISTAITDEQHNIHWFDYDPTTRQIVALLTDKDSSSDIVKPYLLNLEEQTFEPLPKITEPDLQIHYAKWIPYENSLLISRSKIQYINPDDTIATLTGNSEDTEMIVYNLTNKESTQLLTGNTLFYEFFPTPDGLGFSFINSNGALVAYNFATSDQEMISAQFINYFGFSHYGKYALYADKIADDNFLNEEDIAVIQSADGAKKEVRLQGVNPIVIDHLATAPSEETLAAAYTSYPAEFRIALVDMETGEQTLMNESGHRTRAIEFSPNSEYFAYIEDQYDTPKIFIYSMEKKENIVKNVSGSMIHWLY